MITTSTIVQYEHDSSADSLVAIYTLDTVFDSIDCR